MMKLNDDNSAQQSKANFIKYQRFYANVMRQHSNQRFMSLLYQNVEQGTVNKIFILNLIDKKTPFDMIMRLNHSISYS